MSVVHVVYNDTLPQKNKYKPLSQGPRDWYLIDMFGDQIYTEGYDLNEAVDLYCKIYRIKKPDKYSGNKVNTRKVNIPLKFKNVIHIHRDKSMVKLPRSSEFSKATIENIENGKKDFTINITSGSWDLKLKEITHTSVYVSD